MRGQKTIPALIGAALLALGGVTGLTGCVAAVTPSGYAYVSVPPPHPQYEVVGVAPGYDYVWIKGHHAWRG